MKKYKFSISLYIDAMKKRCLIISVLVLAFGIFKAQFDHNWCFGANARLSFTANPPTSGIGALTNNPDNTSTISDANGNLLFYTDGMVVRDVNNFIMPNGSGLIGHGSAGQCALIVPIPCSTKYVIFHVTEFSNPGYLNYTVVDMSLNGGLGDVVPTQKNISLGSGWTEKLCAIYNPLNNSYWMLTHKWGNDQFVAFVVDATTIATQSVVSSIGSSHSCGSYGGPHDAMGQLTISRDGTKVINAMTCLDQFELFNFNLSTGVLSNSIVLSGEGYKAWGTAFSPDSKMLYTNSIFGTNVFQYDINVYTQLAITASKNAVLSVANTGYNFGYMELGPNNKLYIARPGQTMLSNVNNPNNLGALSNATLQGQSISPYSSTHGLSRIAYNITNAASPSGTLNVSSSTGNFSICPGQSLILNASGASSYTWFPGPNTSTYMVSPLVTSNFTLSAYMGCAVTVQSIVTVHVKDAPILNISGTSSICTRATASLTATGASSYQWSNGMQGSTITFSPLSTGIYTVVGTNAATGCTAALAYQVNVMPIPTISLSGPSVTCVGSLVNYAASGASTYTWSMGLNGPSISFTPQGSSNYTVYGTSNIGCSATATLFLAVVECLGIDEIKAGDAFRLSPNPVDDRLLVISGNELTRSIETIELYDENGNSVRVFKAAEMDIEPEGLRLNFSNLIKGVYLLSIRTKEQVFTKKIIKN